MAERVPPEFEAIQRVALQRSEEKFRMLFDLSPVGMAMVDNETGDFLEVNPALLEATGYTREEFMVLSFWDITPEEYAAQEQEQLLALQERGRFGPNEKEYIRKDGSRFPIKISGFLLTDVDGREVVWGLIEDISAEKAAHEERERLIARLEKALAEIRTLSGTIPICSFCKKIRNDDGAWERLEKYISEHSDAQFSHGLCEECLRANYPEYGD